MGFLAAVPAALGSLGAGMGSAAAGASALAGTTAAKGIAGATAAGAGAAGAGAGLSGVSTTALLGSSGGFLSSLGSLLGDPSTKSLGSTLSAGSKLIETLGDLPLGAAMPSKASPVESLKKGADLGASLRHLLGGGGGETQQNPLQDPIFQGPAMLSLLGGSNTSNTLGAGGGGYTPTAYQHPMMRR